MKYLLCNRNPGLYEYHKWGYVSYFNMEDELEFDQTTHCTVCREYLFEPRMFECGHSLCLGCQLRVNFTCPLCRKHSKKVVINFGLRDLLQKLNLESYKRSAKIYEEGQLERAYKEIYKNISKEKLEDIEIKDKKRFQKCCRIAHQYDYWVIQKDNQIRFDQFYKREGDSIKFSVSSDHYFDCSYIEHFIWFDFKNFTYLFF